MELPSITLHMLHVQLQLRLTQDHPQLAFVFTITVQTMIAAYAGQYHVRSPRQKSGLQGSVKKS